MMRIAIAIAILAAGLVGCAKEPVIHAELALPDPVLMAPKSALPAIPADAGLEAIAKDAAKVSSVCVYDQRRLTDLQKYVRTVTSKK